MLITHISTIIQILSVSLQSTEQIQIFLTYWQNNFFQSGGVLWELFPLDVPKCMLGGAISGL